MFKHIIALVGLSVLTLSANAALYDRGGGMIYDDTRNITWLQDANYAMTQYTATNGSQGTADGQMTWADAKTWADGLNYGGYDDWRLPSVGSAPINGYNIITGELGQMFYNNLSGALGTPMNVSFSDGTPGGGTKSFLNVEFDAYWYDQAHASHNSSAWSFETINGMQSYYPKDRGHYSWAVRTGDVTSEVPLSATAWMLGTALLGLAGLKRGYR